RAPSRSRASKRGRAAGETGGTAARTGSASPERQRDGFAQRQRRPRVPLQTEPVAEALADRLRSPLHQGKRVASLEPLPTLSGNRLGRREQSCRCPRIALHAHAPECCKRFDGERRGLELDRRPESLLENRPRGLVLAVRDQHVGERILRVRRFPPPAQPSEQRHGVVEGLACLCRASLVEERDAEQEGDPAEAAVVSELPEKRLALVEQAPALVEIRLVEAENSERPFDLTLVVSFARDLQ